MAYKFYKITKKESSYVFKENFSEFIEYSAINILNKELKSCIESKLKKGKTIIQAIDNFIWSHSVKNDKEINGYDLIPEWLDYMILDDVDFEDKTIKSEIEKIISKFYYKKGKHFIRKQAKYIN